METQDIDLVRIIRQSGLILLFIALFNRLVSMIFVLNFTTSGVNVTLTFAFLSLSAIFISFVKLDQKFDKKFILLMWILLVIFAVLATIDVAVYASLASALALQVLGVLFIENIDLSTAETKTSLVLATVLQYLIYAGLGQLYLFGTEVGLTIYYLTLLFTTISTQVSEPTLTPHPSSFLAIYPFLNLLLLFIGVPSLVASWTFDGLLVSTIYISYYLVIVQVFMSIAAFLAYLYPSGSQKLPFPSAFYIVALLDVLLFKIVPPISIALIVYLSLSMLMNIDVEKTPHFKLIFFTQQFLALVFLFLYVSAGNWAFLPELLGIISHGLAWFYIFLSGLLFLLINEFLRRLSV